VKGAASDVQSVDDRPVALVLRALYLGDMVTGLPALRMLRTALPGHRIVLAAPATAGGLALMAGVVDELTPALELAELTTAPRGAEVAIDLHGNGPPSRALLERTGAQRIIAYYGGDHEWDADEHEVARWCRLVGEAFALDPPWPRLGGSLPLPAPLPVHASNGADGTDGMNGTWSGVTVIHPGAKARSRQWPPARYAELARRLAAAGHRVVLTGGPGEEQLAQDIAGEVGVPALTALSLRQLLALIAHAGLVFCGDTGIAHVASVYATPSVVLFGPVPPSAWGPPPDGPHRALWPAEPGYRGDPHGTEPDPVLLRISVADVVAAAAVVGRR
jgi:ADP-heptose:LPS heptosyltransferase